MITDDQAAYDMTSYAQGLIDIKSPVWRNVCAIGYYMCHAAFLSARFGSDAALCATGNGNDMVQPYPKVSSK